MLFDTSIAMITVPAARVTGTDAAGPATATARTAMTGDAEPQPEREAAPPGVGDHARRGQRGPTPA